MKTIWKYNLEMKESPLRIAWKGIYEIQIPTGAEFLSVREQHGKPAIWFKVDTENPLVVRFFIIVGTGKQVQNVHEDMKLTFLGSFFLHNGSFVGHVFEVERCD